MFEGLEWRGQFIAIKAGESSVSYDISIHFPGIWAIVDQIDSYKMPEITRKAQINVTM